MLNEAAQFLLDIFVQGFAGVLLFRFLLQWLRAPMRNPVGEFIMAISDFAVLRTRRFVPPVWRLDSSSLLLAFVVELDDAADLRVERVVAADAGSRAWPEARAALADEDHSRRHILAGEELHAEHLRLGVAAVPRRAESLFMSHYCFSSSADSSAASAPLRALPERSCSSAASTSARFQPAAASVICGMVSAATSGPAAVFSALAVGLGFSSAFGLAAAPGAPTGVRSFG